MTAKTNFFDESSYRKNRMRNFDNIHLIKKGQVSHFGITHEKFL